MDIMLTIQPWNDRDLAFRRIQSFEKFNIRKVRVNLKTLYRNEHFEDLFSFIREVESNNKDLEWYFDIGIPNDTLRIVVPSSPYYIKVEKGDKIRIYFNNKDNYDDSKRIYIRKPLDFCLVEELFYNEDHFIYGDGEIEFKICQVCNGYFEAIALNDGKIWDGKAIHIEKNVLVQYDSLKYLIHYIDTVGDRNKNYLICSFVENASQVISVKEKTKMKVISKIETVKGIDNIDELCNVSDGLMLGRGDLYLNIKDMRVFWNKQLVFLEFAKKNDNMYSIVATDILESMVKNKIPSRSDITDTLFITEYSPNVICLSSSVFYSHNFEEIIKTIKKIEN